MTEIRYRDVFPLLNTARLEVEPALHVEVECDEEETAAAAVKAPSSIEYKFPTLTSIMESSALFFPKTNFFLFCNTKWSTEIAKK